MMVLRPDRIRRAGSSVSGFGMHGRRWCAHGRVGVLAVLLALAMGAGRAGAERVRWDYWASRDDVGSPAAARRTAPPRPSLGASRRGRFTPPPGTRGRRPASRGIFSFFAPYEPGPLFVPGVPEGASPSSRPPRPTGYRTLCVRLCDGYYWPVSFSTSRSRFHRDAQMCRSSCAAPTRLFYAPSPGIEPRTMIDLTGRRYGRLANAFRYRRERVRSCSCRPEPWSAEARQRHASYRGLGAAGLAESDKAWPESAAVAERRVRGTPPETARRVLRVPRPVPHRGVVATPPRPAPASASARRPVREWKWRHQRRRAWGSARRRPPANLGYRGSLWF